MGAAGCRVGGNGVMMRMEWGAGKPRWDRGSGAKPAAGTERVTGAETLRDAPVPAQPAVGARPRGSPARSIPPPPPEPLPWPRSHRCSSPGPGEAAGAAGQGGPGRRERGRRSGHRRMLPATGGGETHHSPGCDRWDLHPPHTTAAPGPSPSIPVERSGWERGKRRGPGGDRPPKRLPSKEERGGIATSFWLRHVSVATWQVRKGWGGRAGRDRRAPGLASPRHAGLDLSLFPFSFLWPLLGTQPDLGLRLREKGRGLTVPGGCCG